MFGVRSLFGLDAPVIGRSMEPRGPQGPTDPLSLRLQVPQKVFGPSKPTPNTFLEGTTGALGYT